MHPLIINAIRNRECLSFNYDDLQRVVQPAAFGVSKSGNDCLRCYQIGGGHINPGHEWDLCLLHKISQLKGTGERFINNPPGYRRNDKGMIRIYEQL